MRRVARQRPTREAVLGAFAVQQEHSMMDLVMLAFGLALFALAVGYGYACERL
jgi:hypothetical protein